MRAVVLPVNRAMGRADRGGTCGIAEGLVAFILSGASDTLADADRVGRKLRDLRIQRTLRKARSRGGCPPSAESFQPEELLLVPADKPGRYGHLSPPMADVDRKRLDLLRQTCGPGTHLAAEGTDLEFLLHLGAARPRLTVVDSDDDVGGAAASSHDPSRSAMGRGLNGNGRRRAFEGMVLT